MNPVLFLASLCAFVVLSEANCDPAVLGDHCAVLFQDINCEKNYVYIDGFNSNFGNAMNDQGSSLQVKVNCTVTLFYDDQFRGATFIAPAGSTQLPSYFNDVASSGTCFCNM